MVLKSFRPDLDIPQKPLIGILLETIEKFGNDIALIEDDSGKCFTFAEIHRKSVQCAFRLRELGLKSGDIVVMMAPNSGIYAVTILGILLAGGIVAPCNPNFTSGEIQHFLNIYEPKFIFTVPDVQRRLSVAKKAIGCFFCEIRHKRRTIKLFVLHDSNTPDNQNTWIYYVLCDKRCYHKQVFTFGKSDGECIPVDSLLKMDNPGKIKAFPADDYKNEILFLLCSSGTTGLPKAVMIGNSYFTALCFMFRDACKRCRTSTDYTMAPMFHLFGISRLFCLLLQGAKHVMTERYTLEKMLKGIEKYKLSHLSAVPPILLDIANSPLVEKYDTSSLKSIKTGAAPIAANVIRRVKNKLNITSIINTYGLTEGVPFLFSDDVLSPSTSAGFLAPNTMLKVIDVKTTTEVGVGEVGELRFKGPQVCKGYYKNPAASANLFDEDGWIKTGDIGYFDESGAVYVVDRLKELIKYKGFQVAPAELEAVLLSHPKILDACVIGVKHVRDGEVPKAFVVVSDDSLTKSNINVYMKEKLAWYKQLRGGIDFVSEVPKSPSGKILRRLLRNKNQMSNL